MPLKQWVNVEKDPKWKSHITGEDAPTSDEEVGHMHLKVQFKNAAHSNFKTQLIQRSGVKYSKKELRRNQSFKDRYANGPSTNMGKKEVQLERDVYLPAAGGYDWLVKAKHKNTEVQAPIEVTARRALFYYSVRQDSTGAPNGTAKGGNVSGQIDDPADLLDTLDKEHWKADHPYFIRLERKGSAVVSFANALRSRDYEYDPANPATMKQVDNTLLWRNQTEEGNLGAFVPGPIAAGEAVGPGATRMDPSNPAKWLGVVRHTDEWAMLKEVKAGLAGTDTQTLKPYCFVIVWCNYIADKAKRLVIQQGRHAAVDTASTSFSVPSWITSKLAFWKRDDVYIEVGKHLWHGFNQVEDDNKTWLVSLRCEFIDAKGGPPVVVNIPNDAVEPAGSGGANHDQAAADFGGYSWIRVRLSAKELASVKRGVFHGTRGQFRFVVEVYVVEKMSCGMALPGSNVIIVCDKANFEKMSKEMKLGIVAHELGHAIGNTAQGGKPNTETFSGADVTTPDFPASLYGNVADGPNENSCQHQGNHCNQGATWNKGTFTPGVFNSRGLANGRWQGSWSGTPQCVMFGAIGVTLPNGTVKVNPSTYCANCKPIVRKLDLGGNLFPNCVTD